MDKHEVKQFLERLHNIAKELNKPLDAPDVIVAYDKSMEDILLNYPMQ